MLQRTRCPNDPVRGFLSEDGAVTVAASLTGLETRVPESETRANALDHVVVVLFENRSLDNVLGHLYGPEDGRTFDGVIGKGLSNPIPERAAPGCEAGHERVRR